MTKQHWLRLMQFAAGFGAVVVAARLVEPLSLEWRKRSLPAGWTLVRPPHETSALALRGDLIWTGGSDGLAPLHRKTAGKQDVAGMPRLSYVRDIVVAADNSLWVAHQSGLTRWDGVVWQHWSSKDGLPAGPLTALCERRGGRMYIGGPSGLSLMEKGAFRHVFSAEQLQLAGVDLIYPDPADPDVLWLASAAPVGGGVVRLVECDGGLPRCPGMENWTRRPGMPHPSVSAVLRTRDGTLWFGTGFGRRGGAIGWKDGHYKVLTREQGLAGEKVRSLFEDSAGRFWIGSEYDGISVFGNGGRRVLTPQQGLAGWEVKEIVEDAGVFWLATEDGVSRIEAPQLFGP